MQFQLSSTATTVLQPDALQIALSANASGCKSRVTARHALLKKRMSASVTRVERGYSWGHCLH